LVDQPGSFFVSGGGSQAAEAYLGAIEHELRDPPSLRPAFSILGPRPSAPIPLSCCPVVLSSYVLRFFYVILSRRRVSLGLRDLPAHV
jgi:hypothetical protein